MRRQLWGTIHQDWSHVMKHSFQMAMRRVSLKLSIYSCLKQWGKENILRNVIVFRKEKKGRSPEFDVSLWNPELGNNTLKHGNGGWGDVLKRFVSGKCLPHEHEGPGFRTHPSTHVKDQVWLNASVVLTQGDAHGTILLLAGQWALLNQGILSSVRDSSSKINK